MFDLSNLPISATAILGVLGYTGFMATAGGPTITHRELAREGWPTQCAAGLRATIETRREPPRAVPVVPDACGVVAAVIPEMRDLCRVLPDPNAAVRQTERLRQQAAAARIAAAIADTGGQCGCAEAIYVEDNRLALALYAGSGRLITPSAVTNRDAALTRALRSPACRAEG